MKQFTQTMLASALGVFIVFAVIIILSTLTTISLIAALSSKEAPVVTPGTILKIQLDGELSEYAADPLSSLSISFSSDEEMPQTAITLDNILTGIAKAKEDPNISGIYLEGSDLSGAPASFGEIRHALADFKESGKFVYGYADQVMTQGNYYIVSVADSIFQNPRGMLELSGLSSTVMYYKDVLKKIGVEPQIFKVGIFKSAVEPFTENTMSAANRAQIESYLGGIWNNMLSEIAASRGLTVEKLNALADEMVLFKKTSYAMESGLVDALLYESDVKEFLARKTFTSADKLKLMDIKEYNEVPATSTKKFQSDKIAILYAAGEIKSSVIDLGLDQGEQITHKSLLKEIERIKDDSHIKSVVFRVNSPGGDAYASDQICHAIGELAKVKPVVVSMGDYAASGGYYISSHASKIVASPTTLTGSIGIFGTSFNGEEIAKKVGLHYSVVSTNKYGDFGNLLRKMTPAEQALMQGYIEEGYDNFVNVCATGRGMSDGDIRKIAEGRVWTGEQGLGIGLVDTLGYLNDAVAVAAEMAGIDEYRIVKYPEEKDLLTMLMESFGTSIKARVQVSRMGLDKFQFMELNWLRNHSGIQARMPYCIEF